MDDGPHAAALVEVGPGAEDEGAPTGVADRDGADAARVAGDGRAVEAGDLGLVDRGEGLADEVRGLAPARAEHERDVVPLGAGALGDDRRRLLRDGEGVGGRIGQEVGTVTHRT